MLCALCIPMLFLCLRQILQQLYVLCETHTDKREHHFLYQRIRPNVHWVWYSVENQSQVSPWYHPEQFQYVVAMYQLLSNSNQKIIPLKNVYVHKELNFSYLKNRKMKQRKKIKLWTICVSHTEHNITFFNMVVVRSALFVTWTSR